MPRFARPLFAFLLPLLMLGALAGWLLGSASGLQTAIRLAGALSGERLLIEQAEGRLAGPLRLGTIHWSEPTLDLTLSELNLDWQPAALATGTLRIDKLQLGALIVQTRSDGKPPVLPADLGLPLAVDLPEMQISRIEQNGITLAEDLQAALSSDGQQHQLALQHLRSHQITISGQLRLAASAPFVVDGRFDVAGQVEAHPLAARVLASGPLGSLDVDLQAIRGIDGDAHALLTPFGAMPFAEARINLRQIDPAAWIAGAPSAQLLITAELQPDGQDITGSFGISNPQPGPLDRERLPVDTLTGQLLWQGERLDFPFLYARLAGAGELEGQGHWQDSGPEQGLTLALKAQRLDASRLLSTLRPTGLKGTLAAQISDQGQTLRTDLRDPRFALKLDLQQQATTVDLKQLELSAGDAALALQGKIDSKTRNFELEGELRRFDPARFAQLPAARINARLNARGALGNQPVIDARFALQDSVFGKHPLSGDGTLKLEWPTLQAAEIHLALAGNRLDVRGAFGRPGDHLLIDIDAQRLAALGADGGISGQIELAGTPAQPMLNARLQADTLGVPARFSARGLKLNAQLAEGDDAPLQLDLRVQQLSTSGQGTHLHDLKLLGDGSRRQHQLNGSVLIDDTTPLHFALNGSWLDQIWQGTLTELGAQDKQRSLRLREAAPFQIGSKRWHIGPLKLAGTPQDWQATLQASARDGRLNASLSAGNPRIGEVRGELSAALASPWALNSQAPWQARLESDLREIDWLGPLLGDSIQTGGQLQGRIEIAGTPATPRFSGQIDGKALRLNDVDNALQLRDGTLAARLTEQGLHIERFRFVNPHSPMPRALRLALAEEAAGMQADGALEISGQIGVDRMQTAGNAELDIRMERLGVSQLADQWVIASGKGKLQWQDGALGLSGALAIDAAYWQLAPAGAPRLSDDVLIRRADQASPPARPKLSLDLSTSLGRNFYFSGAGLNSRLSGDIRLSASGRDLPRASGTIRTRDGRFAAYGQNLDLDRGVFTFQGLPDNPALDVRATRKGLMVEAGVQIGGTARKPVVRLISDPELPDAEKLSWLILGHAPDNLGAGDASVLLAAAGGLLGNDSVNLVQQLKQGFGLDELGVRQGALDGSGGRTPGSRVAGSSIDSTATTGNQILTIGKRLSSNAMLSYEQSLGTAESIVKLSVALNRNISLIGRAGSDNAIDLLYTVTWGQPLRRSTSAANENAPSDRPRK